MRLAVVIASRRLLQYDRSRQQRGFLRVGARIAPAMAELWSGFGALASSTARRKTRLVHGEIFHCVQVLGQSGHVLMLKYRFDRPGVMMERIQQPAPGGDNQQPADAGMWSINATRCWPGDGGRRWLSRRGGGGSPVAYPASQQARSARPPRDGRRRRQSCRPP